MAYEDIGFQIGEPLDNTIKLVVVSLFDNTDMTVDVGGATHGPFTLTERIATGYQGTDNDLKNRHVCWSADITINNGDSGAVIEPGNHYPITVDQGTFTRSGIAATRYPPGSDITVFFYTCNNTLSVLPDHVTGFDYIADYIDDPSALPVARVVNVDDQV